MCLRLNCSTADAQVLQVMTLMQFAADTGKCRGNIEQVKNPHRTHAETSVAKQKECLLNRELQVEVKKNTATRQEISSQSEEQVDQNQEGKRKTEG